MSRWPLKPQVTREGDRIGVFVAGAYQFIDIRAAESLARDLQRAVAIARRDFKHRGKAADSTTKQRETP